MTNHVVTDKHRHVSATVVYSDSQTNEIRQMVERRDQVLIGRLSLLARAASTFFQQMQVYIWAFF